MDDQTNAPQISRTDLNAPTPDNPADMNISLATRQETLGDSQANDAGKMTPDDANELSTDEGE